MPLLGMDLDDYVEHSVVAAFEAQVQRTPNRVAVDTNGCRLTYAELNGVANRLARAIVQRRGPQAEPIALLLERGNVGIVGILAVLKAGKFYVALDPADPPTRLRTLLEAAQVGLLVSNGAHSTLVAELGLDLLDVDEVESVLSATNLDLPISPGSLLNIMFTSGSTGEPKGVLQTHRNLLHAVWARTERLRLTPDDRVVFLLSTSFGVSAAELFGTLLIGAALFPFDVRAQGFSRLASWLDEQQITVYHSVPTVFRGLLNALEPARVLESVRIVQMGGEPVFRHDVVRFLEHFRESTAFHTALGTTETYIAATYELDRATALSMPVLPAGYREIGKEILLVDDDLQLVPRGEVGEILVKSRYLSPGYWRRPDLTAAVFVPEPSGGDGRIYRTGDLGRLLSNGCLLHLGLKDFVVKIRGHSVATTEVEMALREVPGVREAAVVARDNPAGVKRLVGYIVPSGEPYPTAPQLRRALADSLPDYMLPASFVTLDELPRLTTGKVDIRALPAGSRAARESTYVAPRDSIEQELVSIWQDVLGVRPVGVDDDFFDLGGDSLQAVALFAEIEQRFGRRPRLSSLLKAPRVAQLARLLDGFDEEDALVPIQLTGSKPPFFFVHDLSGGVLSYTALARYLGSEQPLYGLEAVGPDDRMETIASRYLDAIRDVQPGGPYRLGGFCFGGFVAYEMARQLESQGDRVALLAIMEGFAPVGPTGRAAHSRRRSIGPRLRNVPVWCAIYGRALLRGGPTEIARRIRLRLLRARRRLAPGEIVDNFSAFSGASREIMSMNVAAVRGYAAAVYSGAVTLFRSHALPLARADDPAMGWSRVAAGGVEIHQFPATHEELLSEPYVRLVARELADCLDRARL